MWSLGRYSFILMYFSLMLISCTKTEILPDLKGNMAGFVYTLNEFAPSAVPSDNSGVLIIALGNKEAYRTFTEKNGRFEFANLPAGTYELQFQKQGYGTLKKFGIKHLGGEPTVLNMPFDHASNYSAFFLHAIPSTEISEMKIEHDSIFCRFSFHGLLPDIVCIQLYISRQENFETNSAELIKNFNMSEKGNMYAHQLSYLTASEIHPGLPFKSGEKIFFRACVSPFYGLSIALINNWYLTEIDTYFDYENNRVVFPALGKESAQYSYIVP